MKLGACHLMGAIASRPTAATCGWRAELWISYCRDRRLRRPAWHELYISLAIAAQESPEATVAAPSSRRPSCDTPIINANCNVARLADAYGDRFAPGVYRPRRQQCDGDRPNPPGQSGSGSRLLSSSAKSVRPVNRGSMTALPFSAPAPCPANSNLLLPLFLSARKALAFWAGETGGWRNPFSTNHGPRRASTRRLPPVRDARGARPGRPR